jgi:transglutaminase-like putative cysteine protease
MYARSSEAAVEPMADDAVRWDDVVEATYVVHQRFRYDYPGPIADPQHRLIVVPRERHGDQRRVASRLDVSENATVHDAHDAFGNPVATIFARRIERFIEFSHLAIVTRSRAFHIADAGLLADAANLTPTELTAASEELRDAARTLRGDVREPELLADRINAYVHGEMRYVAGSTTVETTAAAAFARRTGVCQDFAHVMLAIARRAGLAARYVSGHLIGEGGTHAWVEVLLPADGGTRVVAYDPTHGNRVDMRYVVIAVGRDYADVAPTSGVFTAPYSGELTTTKRVGATRVLYGS